jgi:hypothetical protein
MALTPQQMMMLRRGPTAGPTPNPGGAAPGGAPPGAGVPGAGMPATPGAESPGNLLMTAIAQKMNEQKKSNADFASKGLDQLLRVVSAMQINVQQMHPSAARHLNRAWSALASAKKDLADAAKEAAVPTGPPLGFSGAGIRGSQVSPIAGQGGGGMGVPS